MIFYLDNNSKFHLYCGDADVIYIEYVNAILKPMLTSVRWFSKLAHEKEHMKNIIDHLTSDLEKDRDVGKKMLEQTLKININGRVVGHYEGSSLQPSNIKDKRT